MAVVAVVIAAAAHLSRVGWGLDRTDEGQYLLLMNDPEVSRATVFLYGYVLHPLYEVVGGDITALRVAGILGCVAIAAVLGALVSWTLALPRAHAVVTTVVAAGFGLGPTLYFPLTPSYNTLAFWGVCAWAIGLVLVVGARAGRIGSPLPGALLVGLAGVVAFSGKATTGAALAALTVVVVVVFILSCPDPRRESAALIPGVAAGAAVGLVGLMALVGHGPGWFVDFYRAGARSVSLLQGHEDMVRLDPFSLDGLFAIPTLMAFVAVCIAMSFAARRSTFGLVLVSVQLVATIATVGLALTGEVGSVSSPVTLLGWWLIPAIVLGAVTERPTATIEVVPARDRLVLVAVFAVLPLAYVIGTNGNYWIAQSRAALFWVVAGILVLLGRQAQRTVFVSGAGLLLAVVAVQSLGHAYRYEAHLPPRDLATAEAVVDPEGTTLRLTAQDAETSAQLHRLSETYGLVGTPILDVTGASPGYIRQLGGRPVGSSWLLGGYPGSEEAALDAVRHDQAAVEGAWVLDAPDSPRRIPGLLPALGLSAERDFEVVATFRHVLGYDVNLLRPRG